eukprot:8072705-Lingulodinium_polyedra.AAC.1
MGPAVVAGQPGKHRGLGGEPKCPSAVAHGAAAAAALAGPACGRGPLCQRADDVTRGVESFAARD